MDDISRQGQSAHQQSKLGGLHGEAVVTGMKKAAQNYRVEAEGNLYEPVELCVSMWVRIPSLSSESDQNCRDA
jgi:hypothetical protein